MILIKTQLNKAMKLKARVLAVPDDSLKELKNAIRLIFSLSIPRCFNLLFQLAWNQTHFITDYQEFRPQYLPFSHIDFMMNIEFFLKFVALPLQYSQFFVNVSNFFLFMMFNKRMRRSFLELNQKWFSVCQQQFSNSRV